MYRVTNKTTGILEETGQSMYEAMRYAMMHSNAIINLMDKGAPETAWPAISSDDRPN